MELPINMQPKVMAYLHHAIVNAVIDSPELLKGKIVDYDHYEWDVRTQNVKVVVDKDGVSVIEGSPLSSKSKFFITRECRSEDSLTFRVDSLKNAQRGAHVNVYIGNLGRKNGVTGAFYRMCIHQYGTTTILGRKHRVSKSWDINKVSWYRIVRKENVLFCYASYDGTSWYKVEEINMKWTNGDVSIGVFADGLATNEYRDWLASNYIQLFLDVEDSVGRVFLDYRLNPIKNYRYEYRNADQFLDISYNRLEEITELNPDIVTYLKKRIEQRWYVAVNLDEYYVPQRSSFQKNHFYHHNLIYGYDDKNDSFLVLGYAKKIVTSSLPVENIRKMELNLDTNIMEYKRSYNSNTCKLDVKNLLYQLEMFYNGTGYGTSMGNLLADHKGVFGLKVFETLRDTPCGQDLLLHDVRISYVLYEHMQLMYERVCYLKQTLLKNMDEANLLEKIGRECYKKAEQLKNLVVKNNCKAGGEANIFVVLNELYEAEKELITKLIEVLKVVEKNEESVNGNYNQH